MPERPSSRSKQRSPPLRSKTLRTNVVYERLRERRERLGRLRDQLGLRPRYQKELTKSVSDYDSETETVSEDENLYRGQRPEVRSYKSLTSVESARQGMARWCTSVFVISIKFILEFISFLLCLQVINTLALAELWSLTDCKNSKWCATVM